MLLNMVNRLSESQCAEISQAIKEVGKMIEQAEQQRDENELDN